ncbi:MAG TPA: SDR family oxidoreductase [Bacteroidales bacterium]|nr:SDR family oxidoreductase [Bacteroidales bacterium]HPT01891.1 SDR family oxidoreductase [Bacteroidales bacterium]
MKKTFDGKTIWITGASSGIGEALAYELASCRTHLILSARRMNELERVAARCREAGCKCSIFPIDLSDPVNVETTADKVIAETGAVDILFNNGGISQRSTVIDTKIEVDRKIMEIDYFSGVILTKKVLPAMVKNGYGHIIAISSITGIFGFPLRSGYAAAKHALHGFYETLWAELHDKGINVTVVRPGRIRTNISLGAVTGTGKVYGIMDHGQDTGISAETCAHKILKAVERKKILVNIVGRERLMIFFKKFVPCIFYRLVSKVKPT